MSNETSDVSPFVAPWGYQYLYSQNEVDATWMFQLFETLVLGGYVWDVVISLVPDLDFIFRRRFNYVTVVFVVNRISAILCVAGFFVFNVAHPSDCDTINKVTAINESICQLTAEALLLVRVWALYRKQIYIPILMAAWMLVGPIVNIITWVQVHSISLPGNSGCHFDAWPPSYSYVPFLMQALFDLVVFLLCTLKILSDSGISIRNPHRTLDLMRVSQEFLKGGFVYYIPNVVIQVVTIGFIMSPSHPLQFVTTSMADAVASAQALRITRNLWKAAKYAGGSGGSQTQGLRNQGYVLNSKISSEPIVEREGSGIELEGTGKDESIAIERATYERDGNVGTPSGQWPLADV